MPSDANGVPFNADCVDTGENLIADMRARPPPGRSNARSRRGCASHRRPGLKDMLDSLVARDTMHHQQ